MDPLTANVTLAGHRCCHANWLTTTEATQTSASTLHLKNVTADADSTSRWVDYRSVSMTDVTVSQRHLAMNAVSLVTFYFRSVGKVPRPLPVWTSYVQQGAAVTRIRITGCTFSTWRVKVRPVYWIRPPGVAPVECSSTAKTPLLLTVRKLTTFKAWCWRRKQSQLRGEKMATASSQQLQLNQFLQCLND